ncbi:hypothetical protein B7H23_05660 [Notoacmeibacter marinus]|uniref:Uncharacterized protein n=1 Tax=Notoacmeibacter marinus TaxID=1876515 RepID=A0A231V2K2_9HYPH|nr:hypothetical protein [Notoacmeibacter marinus]OXT02384.1 hypothetical protein B7H23_05660 [Notoacmeibacter marinus]
MDDYNFRADLLDTFQSAPDAIKALMLILPLAFALGLLGLLLHHRRAARRMERQDAMERAACEAEWERMMEATLADLRWREDGVTGRSPRPLKKDERFDPTLMLGRN